MLDIVEEEINRRKLYFDHEIIRWPDFEITCSLMGITIIKYISGNKMIFDFFVFYNAHA